MLSVEQPLFPKDVLNSPIPPSSGTFPGLRREDIVEKYISTIFNLYNKLSKFQNLDPAPEVNAVFGSLVSVCTETPNESIAEKV